MIVIGGEFLQSQLSTPGIAVKAVLNVEGVIFFPVSEQHRDQKALGISYADDYQGNALAAMISQGKIEIRNHRDFSAKRVADIMTALLSLSELAELRTWRVTYRGVELSAYQGD